MRVGGRRAFESWLAVFAGAALILIAVAAFGRPTVFTDTDDYYSQGEQIVGDAHDAIDGAWERTFPPKPAAVAPPTPADEDEAREDAVVAAQAAMDRHMSHTQMAARSVSYSLFLFGVEKAGTLWLVTAVQGLAVAWLIFLLFAKAAPRAPLWSYGLLMAGLCVTSTLPFFAGFAMPDIFAGIAALAEVLLLFYWDKLGRRTRWAVGAILTFALAVHGSHRLTLIVALIPAGLLMAWLRAPKAWRPLGAIAAALVVASLSNTAYAVIVKATSGDKLRRPPFLTARVLADGPGRAYLKAACDDPHPFTICAFRNKRLVNSEEILWSDLTPTGVFNHTNYATRVKLDDEDVRFALSVIRFDPVGEIRASLYNWGKQLSLLAVGDPLLDPVYFFTNSYWSDTTLPSLLNRVADCGPRRDQCRSRMTYRASQAWHGVLFGVATLLAVVGLWLHRRLLPRSREDMSEEAEETRRLIAAVVLLIAVIVLNAAVCGILSGAFARYQARLTWLMPAAAGLMLIQSLTQSASQRWREARRRGVTQGVAFATLLLDQPIVRYLFVGTTGFLVDAAVLHLLVYVAGLDRVSGRLISFPVAVAVTWLLNRTWTFRSQSNRPWREAGLYLAVQVTGGAANIGVYLLAQHLFPALKSVLIIPLAFGSVAGLCLTFLGSRYIAFRPSPTARSHRAESVEA